MKTLWHDAAGMSLYARQLERGRFIWPTPMQGVVSISSAQLGYMLDGIDWRNRSTPGGRRRQDRGRRADATNYGRVCIPQYPTRCRLCLNSGVPTASTPAIDDVATLRAALLAEQAARRVAEQRASGTEAIIAHLKLVIAQRHDRFGASSGGGRKLLDQVKLQVEEAEATATEDDTAAG